MEPLNNVQLGYLEQVRRSYQANPTQDFYKLTAFMGADVRLVFEWLKDYPEHRDYFRSRIMTSRNACLWGIHYHDHDAAFLVHEEEDVLKWLKVFPEDANTKHRYIRSSQGAFEYAKMFPDFRHLVSRKVTDSYWIDQWLSHFKEDL